MCFENLEIFRGDHVSMKRETLTATTIGDGVAVDEHAWCLFRTILWIVRFVKA